MSLKTFLQSFSALLKPVLFIRVNDWVIRVNDWVIRVSDWGHQRK
jgi:hypothetical protein